jgi:hypothetical protein
MWIRAARGGGIASLLLATLSLASVGCDGSGDRGASPAFAEERSELPAGVTPPRDPGGITAEEDAAIPPGPPGIVLVSHYPELLHHIEWQGTRDDTIRGYQVYRSCPGRDWEEIGFVKLRGDDERNRATYVFEDRFDSVCDYTVAAVDHRGNPGPKSVEIQ